MSAALSRRGLLGAIICAPAIVRASSLMPIKVARPGIAYIVFPNMDLATFGALPTHMLIGSAQMQAGWNAINPGEQI